jgi:hypothetical protein
MMARWRVMMYAQSSRACVEGSGFERFTASGSSPIASPKRSKMLMCGSAGSISSAMPRRAMSRTSS